MSKLVTLKKSVLRQAAVAIGALAIFGGVTYGVDSFVSSKAEETAKLQGNLQSITSQTNELERKIDLVQSSIQEYRGLKTDLDAKRYDLDREKALKIIGDMRQTFRLTNVKVDISADAVFTDPQLTKYPTTEADYRTVKITFGAITDLHVYAFVEALMKMLPGFIKITDITMTRSKLIEDSVLVDAAKGGAPEGVQAEIDFLWIGLRLKTAAGATATGVAGGPNAPR